MKEMKRGKAAGLYGLSVEHLSFCHPILPGISARLFNLVLKMCHIHAQFGMGFTVPLVEVNICTKNVYVESFLTVYNDLVIDIMNISITGLIIL